MPQMRIIIGFLVIYGITIHTAYPREITQPGQGSYNRGEESYDDSEFYQWVSDLVEALHLEPHQIVVERSLEKRWRAHNRAIRKTAPEKPGKP